MKLIDSHCHLDFEPLSKDLERVIRRADEASVSQIINVGTSLLRSREVAKIADAYPNVWASVGLHPHESETVGNLNNAVEELRLLAQSKKVVAIGEIGLDYYSDQGPVTSDQKKKQKELFRAQLSLARELNLPVIIHIRDAWGDFFSMIENWKLKIGNYPKGVVHCFTGDAQKANHLVKLGFHIGFTGLITFKNTTTDTIREAVKVVPLEHILVETDAPFLAPEPYRGKTNEPAFVLEVAKKIAELKDIPLVEVAESTTKNCQKLFNIK